MRRNIYTKQEGYIALISAIILSVLLLAITFTLSFTAFYSRFNVLDSEFKKISNALAEACANNAIIKLANDKDYVLTVWDHAIPVGTKYCDINSLSPAPPRTSQIIIKTQGIDNKAYTDLEVKVTPGAGSMTIDSWKECATFTSC